MTTLTVGTVPEGAPFRLIRCARNYPAGLQILARTFRAGTIADGYRYCADARDLDWAFHLDRPVVLVETIGTRALKSAPAVWAEPR
jgi:hypothetical protein